VGSLKERARDAVEIARKYRERDRAVAAQALTVAGELRRSALYVYGSTF
jgi:hypothetical protein